MAAAPPLSRRRRVTVGLLIALATLLAFVSILTLWVKRQLLDNHAWATASQKVIVDKQVQDALSVYLVNQLYQNVDVAAALRQRLPSNLDPLAAPLAATLRQPAANSVSFLLAQPRVQSLWVNVSARAHEKLVNVLENKTGEGITSGNGAVTLQTGALLNRLAKELGLPGKVVSKIPPDAGTITLLRSNQLKAAQDAVQVERALSRWLLVLVLALYALAAYLARGQRRVRIRTIGWCLTAVGLAVLITRKLVGNYVVNAITSPEYRGTGHRVWLIGTSVLGNIGWASVFYGVALVLAMALAGETAPARAARRYLAPIVTEDPFLTWGSAAVLLLLLVLWGPTYALRTWWGILIAAVLIAAGVVALRRQLREERDSAPGAQDEAPKKRLALTS